MANPKYANLPGIAYDQPDVYETSDLPESDQNECFEEEVENESIERLHISAKDAFGKFKGKILTGNVDFSDRLTRKSRTGYDSRSGDWELAAYGEKETPLQRYQRIRCDIADLLEEIAVLQGGATDEEKVSYDEMAAQVSTTRRLMEELQLDDKLGSDNLGAAQISNIQKLQSQLNTFQSPGKQEAVEEKMTRSASSLAQANRVADLELRLHKLESLLGATPDKLTRLNAATGCITIVGAAQTLSSRAALMQPAQLDLIEARLGSIMSKMDAIVQQSGGAQEAERDQRIIDLYDTARNTESMSQLVPELIQRMQTLEALHKEASSFSKWLKELEMLQNANSSGIENNKSLLQGVQEVFAANLQSVNSKIVELDGKIKNIEKK